MDHSTILRYSHIAMICFNLVGIVLVFIWSGLLWGRGGAYLSLLLAGFSPNFIGHMALATSDFSGAWTLVTAVLALAWMVEKCTLPRILAAGATAALALLCKHSAVLLGPVAVVLVLWRLLDGRVLEIHSRSIRNPLSKVLALAVAGFFYLVSCCLLIWAAYGFRYSAANPEVGSFTAFLVPWEDLNATLFDPCIQILRQWKLLPEAFLYGLNLILSVDVRGSFLNGSFSEDGFLSYYFWTFLYKTPIPALVLHLLGIVLLLRMLIIKKNWTQPILIRGFIVLFLVYGMMLLSSNLSIGHRHTFVLLYISCIFTGISVKWAADKRPWILYLIGILSFSMLPLCWLNIDRTVAYMNIIGGGESEGYRHLMDSSLDWGQDLPSAVQALQAYQETNQDREVYLSYFGTAEPAAYGLKNFNYLYAWGIWNILERPPYQPEFFPGLYAISASEMKSTLQDWSVDLEIRFRQLSATSIPLYAKLESSGDLSSVHAAGILTPEEIRVLDDHEMFRTQRLKMCLGLWEPDDILHGTILLYDLNAADLEAVRKGEPRGS